MEGFSRNFVLETFTELFEKIQENSVKMGEKIKDALHGDLRTYV